MVVDTKVNQKARRRKTSDTSDRSMLAVRICSYVLWLLFAASLTNLVLYTQDTLAWAYKDLLVINGFTLLIWTTVTFFSAIVGTYASNYLRGSKFHLKFMALCLGFTLSVLLLVMANHILILLASWLTMGIFMSHLIGIDTRWGEAGEALKFARKYFFLGTTLLALGIGIVAIYSNEYTVQGIADVVNTLPRYITLPSALCLMVAAIVQSAIYPFHKWLLSAMTAPTPASALMHAGFVNGAGILLALFATLLLASNTLALLFVVGGLTAIIAQFTKLLQVNVKQKLACSTIAQMGFMIMQCGLGFFNAAVAHLILHGFYKSYLFLSSGEEIAQSTPKGAPQPKITIPQAIAVIILGGLGALLFMLWTGKGFQLDSSVFLTLIVAITVGQATYNIVKERSLSIIQKTVGLPIMFILGIGLYALMYNGVTTMMGDLPMISSATPLSWPQIIFGLIFLMGFFVMKTGVYRKIPWLYVVLLNASQPYKKTVLMYKSKTA